MVMDAAGSIQQIVGPNARIKFDDRGDNIAELDVLIRQDSRVWRATVPNLERISTAAQSAGIDIYDTRTGSGIIGNTIAHLGRYMSFTLEGPPAREIVHIKAQVNISDHVFGHGLVRIDIEGQYRDRAGERTYVQKMMHIKYNGTPAGASNIADFVRAYFGEN